MPEFKLPSILTEGVIVHYVLDEGMQQGRHRAALVVNVIDRDAGICDLIVFTDAERDKLPPFVSKRAIHESDARAPGTWHWIEA